MGQKKREKMGKKNSNDHRDGEGQSSSSSLGIRRSLRSNTGTVNVNVNVNVISNQVQEAAHKKQKKTSTEDSSTFLAKGQGQGSEVKKVTTLDNLPAEMLTKILKCVDTTSLFDCRLVSRNFSAISSGILCTRSDAALLFVSYPARGQKVVTITCLQRDRELKFDSLKDFCKCMKKSENCPYSHFTFAFNHLRFFEHKDWIAFLRQFAPPNPNQNQNQRTKIKCLNLDFSIDDLDSVGKKLADLLVNKIPHLEEFSFTISSAYKNNKQHYRWFPCPSKTEAESIPVAVQLPHLKVLHVDEKMLCFFPGLVGDLLNAAVNLRSIRDKNLSARFRSDKISDPRCFEFLQSVGKLALLQHAEIKVDQDFLSVLKRLEPKSNFCSAFKLKDLYLKAAGDLDPTCLAQATNFISSLLESCKSSLQKLELRPLGFLPGLQLPTFPNLTTLTLSQRNKNDDIVDDEDEVDLSVQPFFPPETRTREIFPNVKDLDFQVEDCSTAFPQEDSIPRLPNVRTLALINREFGEKYIRTLYLMCPNLEKLKLAKDKDQDDDRSEVPDFLVIGRAIWTHMQQLVSLEVDVAPYCREYAFPALDSLFTGISPENCRGLNHLKLVESGKNQQPERKDPKHGKNLSAPKSEPTAEREHPSILDMKNLKKLVINPYSRGRLYAKKTLFTTRITWISQEYAFKLMPQLEFNGRKAESTAG